jgi:hypothetical protein
MRDEALNGIERDMNDDLAPSMLQGLSRLLLIHVAAASDVLIKST